MVFHAIPLFLALILCCRSVYDAIIGTLSILYLNVRVCDCREKKQGITRCVFIAFGSRVYWTPGVDLRIMAG